MRRAWLCVVLAALGCPKNRPSPATLAARAARAEAAETTERPPEPVRPPTPTELMAALESAWSEVEAAESEQLAAPDDRATWSRAVAALDALDAVGGRLIERQDELEPAQLDRAYEILDEATFVRDDVVTREP